MTGSGKTTVTLGLLAAIRDRGLKSFALPNGIASYTHLHFLSNLNLSRNMLQS